jgi:PTS system beta-glucosides-specific IIC component
MFRELFSCREAPRADRHDNPPEDTDSNDREEGSDMADNAQTAKDVLAAVGGAENVTNLIHCITRLRFSLKDESIPEIDEIKKIPGVIGAQWSGGQFQVIIGQNVTKVYDEVMKLGITGGGSIDIDEGDVKKFEWTPQNVGNVILNYLSKTMVAMIPIMMGGAFFRVIATMAGPLMLNLWAEDSQIYQLFYTWMYDAAFYFMPIYLGYSAAVQLNCSKMLGMFMGGILICPDLVALAQAGEVTSMSVYGIPAPVVSYAQTVLPIILCMPVLAQVEKLMKKIVPDMLSTVFVPFLTMLIMVPVAYCVLAPVGNRLGDLVGAGLFAFGTYGGFIAVGIIGALWSFLVMTGMHQVLIVLAITQLMSGNPDGAVMVGASIAQFATWGMAFGAFLKLREKNEKMAQLGFALSGIIGGVTEPEIYGTGFKYMRPMAGMVAGGFVGGALAGLLGVKVYMMGATNILGVLGYVDPSGANASSFVMGVIASVAAFVVSTAVVYFFGFTKEQLEEDRKAAEAAKAA